MKNLLFSGISILLYACGSARTQPLQNELTNVNVQKADTCFYEIRPAADMDVPKTPHWDTTITRTGGCKVHCLKMSSWGTESQYTMSGPDGKNTINRSCHFHHDQWGIMDITGIPAGDYGCYLLACGNGGGFTIHIK